MWPSGEIHAPCLIHSWQNIIMSELVGHWYALWSFEAFKFPIYLLFKEIWKVLHLSSSVSLIRAPLMNFQIEIPSEIWDKHEEVWCIFCIQHKFNAFEISSATITKFSFQIICQFSTTSAPWKDMVGTVEHHHGPANLAGIHVSITWIVSTQIAILLKYTNTLPLVYIESRSELKLLPKLSYNQLGVA